MLIMHNYIDKYTNNWFNIVNLEHSKTVQVEISYVHINYLRILLTLKDIVLWSYHVAIDQRFQDSDVALHPFALKLVAMNGRQFVIEYVHFVRMWLKMRHMSSCHVHYITIYGYKWLIMLVYLNKISIPIQTNKS